MVSESKQGKSNDEIRIEERAGDAKFFLSIGSGAFFLFSVIFFIPLVIPFFLPILLPLNVVNAFFIAGFAYLIPGLILFIWGLGKVFRGKDLSFEQVWKARIQRKDVKRTARFLIFVSFFVILLIVPVLIGFSILDIMNGIIGWCLTVFGPIGIYIGIFLISIFGNFTVIFPIPYLFVLLITVLNWPGFTLVDGLILGVIAGAGAAIGETTAWLLGRSQTETLEDSPTGLQMLKLRGQIERGYGGVLILIYAATPLPDDILLIALGATKYPLWKAIGFCFIGKVILSLLITIGAMFFADILLVIFGGGADPIMDTAYLLVGIALIGLFFVPWGRLVRKIRGNSE